MTDHHTLSWCSLSGREYSALCDCAWHGPTRRTDVEAIADGKAHEARMALAANDVDGLAAALVAGTAPVWEVRALTGTLAVRDPRTNRVKTTTGGWVAIDTAYGEDPVGPFPSARQATAWVADH